MTAAVSGAAVVSHETPVPAACLGAATAEGDLRRADAADGLAEMAAAPAGATSTFASAVMRIDGVGDEVPCRLESLSRSAFQKRFKVNGVYADRLIALLRQVRFPGLRELEPQETRAGGGRPARMSLPRIEWPGDLRSKRGIWERLWRLDVRIVGVEGLEWYTRVRRLLVDSTEPHPRAAALALLTVCDGRPERREVWKWLKGEWETIQPALDIVDQHLATEAAARETQDDADAVGIGVEDGARWADGAVTRTVGAADELAGGVDVLTLRTLALRFGCGGPDALRLIAVLMHVRFPGLREVEPQMTSGEGSRAARVYARRFALPRSLESRREVWDALWRLDIRLKGEDGFRWYHEVRRLLVDKLEPHPRPVALALLTVIEGRPGTMEASRWLKGDWSTVHAACGLVDEHLGKSRRVARGSLSARLSLDDLIARHPLLDGLEGTCRDPEFSNHAAPPEETLGRTTLMAASDLEVVLGMFLMVAQSRLGVGTIKQCVLVLEALDDAEEPGAPALGSGMTARLRAVCVENRLELSESRRSDFLRFYAIVRTCMTGWFDELPVARRAIIQRFLPPAVPLDLTADVADVAVEAETRRLDRREATAGPISKLREGILRTVERRFEPLDALVGRIERRMDEVSADLAAGRPVRFPVGVRLTHRVLRPGLEGIGGGRQTTRCIVETVQRLWFMLATAEEEAGMPRGRRLAWHHLDAADRERVAPRSPGDGPHGAGGSWDPAYRTALRVVYVGTHAAEAGGERVEPFWAEMCRGRLFDASGDLSSEDRAERDRLVALIGADPVDYHCAGMLRFEDAADRALARAWTRLRPSGSFLWAWREFHHAMTAGRVVMRAELMRGLRIGETTQAREDDGAFGARRYDGRLHFWMRVSPKWARGGQRRMVIDTVTARAFEQLRALAVRRWHSAMGRIPVTDFFEVDRRELIGPARYLLSNATGMLRPGCLNLYLRLLTIGIVSSASHSYKSGFAALLIGANAPEALLNRGLNHAFASASSPAYTRWAEQHLADAFIAAQQTESEKKQLEWEIFE